MAHTRARLYLRRPTSACHCTREAVSSADPTKRYSRPAARSPSPTSVQSAAASRRCIHTGAAGLNRWGSAKGLSTDTTRALSWSIRTGLAPPGTAGSLDLIAV